MALDGGPDRGDHLVLLGLGQARVHRQGEGPGRGVIGDRQVGVEAALLDVGLAMDRDRVVDVGPDAGLAEVGDDRVASPADIERVLVEDVAPAVGRDRQPDRQLAEGRVVAGGDRLAAGSVARQLGELDEADRGSEVRHPEIEAEHLELVAGAHALVPVQAQPIGEAVVVGRDEAALGGRHVLRGIQAERAVPERARHPAAERCAMGLAGILDHDQAVAIGNRPDHVHVRDEAEQVDRADRPRPGGDGLLDLRGIDQVRVRLDVDEDRVGAGREDRVGGRREGVADRDHLVAGLEADAGEDRHQGQRAVAHRDRVLHADVLGPAGLELGDLLALGQHPALEDLGDRIDLFLADVGTGDRDHAGAP